MSDFVIGFANGIFIGIAVGMAIEIAMGIQQKPWSELTDEEKKDRTHAIFIGMSTLVIGVIVFLWLLLT
jgi:hypothetical protein